MSRFKRFLQALISGYVLVVANVFYTLISIPLALHYLSKEEFGLWAVVSQVCNFNMLVVDLGMSMSIARILIDYKDDSTSTKYGEVIQTGLLVLLVQGTILAVGSVFLSYWLPQWMAVEVKYWSIFRQLVIWQCVLLAFSFAFRIFSLILQAHQRYDMCNYSSLAGFAAGIIALWVGFMRGWGLYSMLLGAGALTIFSGALNLWRTWHLHLFPARGQWGRPNRYMFKQLFSYGTDTFLISLGNQLIGVSQAPVIARTLGLEAAAVWSVAIKLFMLSQQLVYRLLDFSTAAFSEMIVRGEKERLKNRFRDLVTISGSLSAAVGLTMAFCNQSFLEIWTTKRIDWPRENDWLMACSLIVYACTRCHIALACMTKIIGNLKYIYFVEGAAFVVMSLVLAPKIGLAGIILSGIATNMLFSGRYGAYRSSKYFGLPITEMVIHWLKPAFVVAGLMAILLLATQSVLLTLSAFPRLIICALIGGGLGVFCLWRFGLAAEIQSELRRRLKNWLRWN